MQAQMMMSGEWQIVKNLEGNRHGLIAVLSQIFPGETARSIGNYENSQCPGQIRMG